MCGFFGSHGNTDSISVLSVVLGNVSETESLRR